MPRKLEHRRALNQNPPVILEPESEMLPPEQVVEPADEEAIEAGLTVIGQIRPWAFWPLKVAFASLSLATSRSGSRGRAM